MTFNYRSKISNPGQNLAMLRVSSAIVTHANACCWATEQMPCGCTLQIAFRILLDSRKGELLTSYTRIRFCSCWHVCSLTAEKHEPASVWSVWSEMPMVRWLAMHECSSLLLNKIIGMVAGNAKSISCNRIQCLGTNWCCRGKGHMQASHERESLCSCVQGSKPAKTLAAARQWQDEDLWRSKHFCKKQRIITTWVRTIQSPLAASQWVFGWFQFSDLLTHVHILTCSKDRWSNASAKNGSKTRPSPFVSCRIWVKLETQYPFRTGLSYMNLEPPRACEVKIASNKFIDPRERGFLTSQPCKVWQFWHVFPLAARTDGPSSLFWLRWIIQPGWWNDGAFLKHPCGCPVIKHARRLRHCQQTLWSSFVFMVHETWTEMLHISLGCYQGPGTGKMHWQ